MTYKSWKITQSKILTTNSLDSKSIFIDFSSIQNEEAVEEKSKTEEIDISDDERAMMVNMFKLFDSDGTGAMSIAELGNFMRAIGETSNDVSNATFVVINDHYDQACSQRMTRWTIC